MLKDFTELVLLLFFIETKTNDGQVLLIIGQLRWLKKQDQFETIFNWYLPSITWSVDMQGLQALQVENVSKLCVAASVCRY